jgi:hypothetical protein
MIRVFALHPLYPLDVVVETHEEMLKIAEQRKKDHPDIPLYGHPVHPLEQWVSGRE